MKLSELYDDEDYVTWYGENVTWGYFIDFCDLMFDEFVDAVEDYGADEQWEAIKEGR